MNDTAIKNFCLEARAMLEEQVQQCAVKYGIVEQGAPAPDAVSVGEVALTELQRSQRAQLLELQAAIGHDELVRRAAYTWFNRLVAIRFMEVNGYLPSGVRMLSAPDGSFGSQAVSEALHVQIAGIEQPKVVELAQSGDNEPLFRYLFLLQCQELAECLPSVFEQVGSAFELLLPEGLSRKGSVVDLLVTCLPETDEEGSPTGTWQDVEILGWMYQFYNAQVKDEFFKSKRKASAADLAPATQLFTPKWIVRYMVENSLGRLWMLNHPDSSLRQHMGYYIEPDAQHEDFLRVESPEEITFCDPACGSGHILSYAFELLFHMYVEAGYRTREIPALILSKNLSGMEIDRRAAQIASLVLALRARQHDRRFFGRGVQADVCVLESVPFEEGELACCGKPLADALTHLGEVGSLLNPTEEDLASLRTELATCEGDLFAHAKAEKIKLAIQKCEMLARRFHVVVANPPYMGSKNLNNFMSGWVKKKYPETKSDLCTCFIERILTMCAKSGFAGLATSNSWMFLSSFESLRNMLIDDATIETLVQLSVHGFHGIAAQVCTFVLRSSVTAGFKGAYIRLNDFDHWSLQEGKTLEAIKNPDCGYFYRADATTFQIIPGSPIAYWASDATINCFSFKRAESIAFNICKGVFTADNNRYLRYWFEVYPDQNVWHPYSKGGKFRKWYGNSEYVIYWRGEGRELKASPSAGMGASKYFGMEHFVWSGISSDKASFRYDPADIYFDDVSPSLLFESKAPLEVLAALNSKITEVLLRFIAPTLHFQAGDIKQLPIPDCDMDVEPINGLTRDCINLSKTDWDSFETSWDFKRHPLL